jgi:hypothetical protein
MQAAWRVQAGHDDDDAKRLLGGWSPAPDPAELEDLPYRVEVWDEAGEFPETLVAVTVTAGLAFAAYYAAAREYVGREITIRHKGHTLTRWRAHPH